MSRDVWRTGEIVRQYEGREVRGMLRRSGYSQPCNAVAGEIG